MSEPTPHGQPDDPPTMHDVDSPGVITGVFVVVLLLSGANIGLSMAGLGGLALPVQLAIASVQAVLVAYYWMHLRRGDKTVTVSALTALFFLAILFILTMPDYVARLRMPEWIKVGGVGS